MLESYVFHHGQRLSQKLKESFELENWLTEESPESIRTIIIEIMEEISSLSDSIRQYCDEGTCVQKKSDIDELGSELNSSKRQHLDIYTPTKFTQRSIILGIVKIVLKAMVEYIRACSFNKNGLQQIQLDILYLQQELGKYVSDENLVVAILKDASRSAELRCLES